MTNEKGVCYTFKGIFNFFFVKAHVNNVINMKERVILFDFSVVGSSDADFLAEYYEIIKEVELLGKIVFVTGLVKEFIELENPIYDQKWIGDFKK